MMRVHYRRRRSREKEKKRIFDMTSTHQFKTATNCRPRKDVRNRRLAGTTMLHGSSSTVIPPVPESISTRNDLRKSADASSSSAIGTDTALK